MNWLPFALEAAQVLASLVAKHSTGKTQQVATVVADLLGTAPTAAPAA